MQHQNLLQTISKNCSHLSKNKQNKIIHLLKKYEESFDGTLGDMITSPVYLEVKKGAVPKHHKPFPVPKIHKMTLKKELKRLCKLGVSFFNCWVEQFWSRSIFFCKYFKLEYFI